MKINLVLPENIFIGCIENLNNSGPRMVSWGVPQVNISSRVHLYFSVYYYKENNMPDCFKSSTIFCLSESVFVHLGAEELKQATC